MQHGAIKWFSAAKGYGFITKANGSDVFVHYTGLAPEQDRYLRPGDAVIFDEVEGEKGRKAMEVRRSPETAPEEPETT